MIIVHRNRDHWWWFYEREAADAILSYTKARRIFCVSRGSLDLLRLRVGERRICEDAAPHLRVKEDLGVRMTTPGAVNRWWRQPAEMYLVENGAAWRIEGEDSERALITDANERDGHLIFVAAEEFPMGDVRGRSFFVTGEQS